MKMNCFQLLPYASGIQLLTFSIHHPAFRIHYSAFIPTFAK